MVKLAVMPLYSVGEKLRIARDNARPHRSQRQLAALLVPEDAQNRAEEVKRMRANISNWEINRSEPPEGTLRLIAAELGLPVAWFYSDDPYPVTPAGNPANPPASNYQVVTQNELTRSERLMVRDDKTLMPTWRGIQCGASEEAYFVEEDVPEFREVHSWITAGIAGDYVQCIASGMSMSPRIEHGDRFIIRIDPDVEVGRLVVARNPEGKLYVKILRRGGNGPQLEPVNPAFDVITDTTDWIIRGGVIYIRAPYEPENGRYRSVEWDEGRYLRA